jgi:hypothetical protein
VVSDNDLHFHRFDDVYRKVVQRAGDAACPRGALATCSTGGWRRSRTRSSSWARDPDAPGFDQEVLKKLDEHLAVHTKNEVPQDFVRVVRTIFELKQKGQLRRGVGAAVVALGQPERRQRDEEAGGHQGRDSEHRRAGTTCAAFSPS